MLHTLDTTKLTHHAKGNLEPKASRLDLVSALGAIKIDRSKGAFRLTIS